MGLIPAGGYATRIEPLPCSKELYPVGFRSVGPNKSLRPKVVDHYLLERMQLAGASKVYVVLRNGKWDIPAYFGDGTLIGCPIAYLMLGVPFGAPYTLDQAWPFVQNVRVVFGFPDILFEPHDVFVRLLDHQAATKADIVLGLFPAHAPSTADMVELDGAGRIRGIKIKPAVTDLRYTVDHGGLDTGLWSLYAPVSGRPTAKRICRARGQSSCASGVVCGGCNPGSA